MKVTLVTSQNGDKKEVFIEGKRVEVHWPGQFGNYSVFSWFTEACSDRTPVNYNYDGGIKPHYASNYGAVYEMTLDKEDVRVGVLGALIKATESLNTWDRQPVYALGPILVEAGALNERDADHAVEFLLDEIDDLEIRAEVSAHLPENWEMNTYGGLNYYHDDNRRAWRVYGGCQFTRQGYFQVRHEGKSIETVIAEMQREVAKAQEYFSRRVR